jgi:predicted RNA-binding protein with PIN domain
VKTMFIDGYNVINSWPNLKSVKDYSYDTARQKLIEILQNYATYRGYKVFIVFDAHMVQGNVGKRENFESVIVIYTKEGETADNYIEKSIDRIGKKSDVCVVTSDSLEQQIAFQRGAIRMSSLELYFEVEEINQRIVKKAKNEYSKQRNPLEERLEKEVLEKLEKIRRSH